ncbi:MAG: enoyl-CoA hydratase/isomerase family protein [Deltaproteobacteria bacterium]|nr:enoyl-CoA hydratase/isomerase family protein [Deltaproteobacteria bacterium]
MKPPRPSPSSVTATREGDVVVVRMSGPRGNALSPSFVKELSLALYQAEQLCGDVDEPQACAIVLCGKDGVFCGGLDLKEGHAMDRGAVAAWVDAFEALFLQLFALRVPVVAALTGSAIAGGAVLALACDERVAPLPGTKAASTFAFGLTEVTLGLPFPSAVLEIARFAVGHESHVDVLLRGKRFDLRETFTRNLVDELAEDVVGAAVERARTWQGMSPRAVGKTKLDLRHDALTRARARAIESRRVFVESWCDPQNAARREALLAQLATKA